MMGRVKKETIIGDIRNYINKSQAIFLTNLIGVSSNESVKIRKEMREANGIIVISKNTLFIKAAAGTKCEHLLKDLKGPSAVVFVEKDVPAAAKVLFQAKKDFPAVSIRGGIFEQKQISVAEIEMLANLPSREQMLGTLLATFMAPVSAFVRVLDQIRVKKMEAVASGDFASNEDVKE